MKRGTMSITKFTKLKLRLKLPAYAAAGLLEALWHLTAKEAPTGNIGKLSDDDIALFLEWPDSPQVLIDALVDCKWLDRHPDHRLIVHDWSSHAEDAVHMQVARMDKATLFADGSIPRFTRLGGSERAAVEKKYRDLAVRTEQQSVRTNATSVRTPSAQMRTESAQNVDPCALPSPALALAKPSPPKPSQQKTDSRTASQATKEPLGFNPVGIWIDLRSIRHKAFAPDGKSSKIIVNVARAIAKAFPHHSDLVFKKTVSAYFDSQSESSHDHSPEMFYKNYNRYLTFAPEIEFNGDGSKILKAGYTASGKWREPTETNGHGKSKSNPKASNTELFPVGD